MKEYGAIIIGTGSALNFTDELLEDIPKDQKIAVIDKDDPGGICLTRGCIPTKLLLYPAELVREIENAKDFGIDIDIKQIDFKKVMDRMRNNVSEDVKIIREGLKKNPRMDYYQQSAEFVSPYTLKVGNEIITSKMIFLCTGSKPLIPQIAGLDKVDYFTSDTILSLEKRPDSIIILGGGFIAAEYAHFFSAMGSKVTVIGRNPRFLPSEEIEISILTAREMSKRVDLVTNHEVIKVEKKKGGAKLVIATDRKTGQNLEFSADEILVATGRGSNSEILHPEKAGIATDANGWITVDEYLETTQPNIWAFGDANGKYLFKHVANYESLLVYNNAIEKTRMKVDYHAIPHAVFTHPEIAAVGLKEKEAVAMYGQDNLLIGFYKFEDTAKGQAMNVKDCFVKAIVKKDSQQILGAHIIGPHASILIQEIISVMYTPQKTSYPISHGMHIHPALSEVVERAFKSLLPIEHYHHILTHTGLV